ncbi:MAG: hypothetical protein WCS85_01825 [Candidatus Peribacteraceae bacterium]
MPTCKQCSAPFEITSDDLAFLEKVSPVFAGKKELIPPPKLCPDCRQQRRLSWRNERNLYHRKCDFSGKQIISMYASDKAQKVYDQDVFWSDKWDPLDTGRPFDFSRPFFDQFAELFVATPRISLINKEHLNSEYCNFSLHNKDSYLGFTTMECENCIYTNRVLFAKNVCDCSNVEHCELCYEVINSDHCYHCQYLQNCNNCSDCFLGYNLRGCRNCFACYNLQNAEYRVGNKQVSKEEYAQLVRTLRKDLAATRRNFDEQKRRVPHKYMDSINAEDCTGNAIINSKNARVCYEVMGLHDCRYLANATEEKDCMDVNNDDHSELVYESAGSEANYMHCFNDICWFDKNLLYCSLCFHCEHCFGCVSLKHRKYCIFNVQYTKEEYEALVPKIITHMRTTGEWGEFFPVRLSPFGYNETTASETTPLTKEEVRERDWKWRDEPEVQKQYLGPDSVPPVDIGEVSDDITKQILRCEITGRPYKIIPQELKFYREMGIPVPRKCPDQRHKERMALRNPRKLWNRNCAKCKKPIATSYAPERPEIVYCEECYLTSVY